MTGNIGWNRNEMNQYAGKEEPAGNGKTPVPVNEQMLEWYYSMREEGRTGETKEQYEARIYAKVQAGKELTIEELRFLERTNPVLYAKAVRVQNMRKMLKNQLRNCKSRQEAQEVFSRAVSGISDKDPDKGMLVAALKDVYMEFTKSDAYKRLPEKKEDEKGQKGSGLYEVDSDVTFDVDESGYQVVFAQEGGIKAFAANG